MDPSNPSSFNHRTEKLSTGRSYHFVDQKPINFDSKRSLTLLLIHGFPDFWYGWRHQIRPWVMKGYRVVVPDMLGYGGTDKPFDAVHYSSKKLCADMAALLDLLEVKQAVVIGHDWGSFAAGRFALWHPDRLLSLVIMSVAYTPPSKQYVSVQDVAKRAPNLTYQTYFNDPRSTKELESNIPLFLQRLYTLPTKMALGSWKDALLTDRAAAQNSLLSEQELGYYISQYTAGGLQGPLNYYRTAKYRFDEESDAGLPSNLAADLPVLFLWGTEDTTTVPSIHHKAHRFVPRLQEVAFEGMGHWLMVEAKDEVVETIDRWLRELHPTTKL